MEFYITSTQIADKSIRINGVSTNAKRISNALLFDAANLPIAAQV